MGSAVRAVRGCPAGVRGPATRFCFHSGSPWLGAVLGASRLLPETAQVALALSGALVGVTLGGGWGRCHPSRSVHTGLEVETNPRFVELQNHLEKPQCCRLHPVARAALTQAPGSIFNPALTFAVQVKRQGGQSGYSLP